MKNNVPHPLLPIATALLGGALAATGCGILLHKAVRFRVQETQFTRLEEASQASADVAFQAREHLRLLSSRLRLSRLPPGCPEALVQQLQLTLLQTPGIRAVMRIEGQAITCATARTPLQERPLGPPTHIRDDGLRTWHGVVPYPDLPDQRYVLLESGQLGMLVLPSEQFARLGQHRGMGLAVYESTQPPRASHTTPGMPTEWLIPLEPDQRRQMVDPVTGTLKVYHRGGQGQATTLATLSGATVAAEVETQFRHVMPLLLIPGLLAAGLVLAFWRRPRTARRIIERALAGNDLFLVYQPVIELANGCPVAVEALLRWRNDEGQVMTPDLFLPLIESQGMSARLTERVCELLVQDLPPIVRDHPGFMVGLNIAAQELSDRRLAQRMRQLKQDLHLGPGQLVVELTESSLVESEQALPVIESMRQDGIRIAIDDFGTGYCSLSYLSSIPFDILKIDRAFINAAGTDSVIGPIAEHVVTLSRAMGVDALAEGIESAEQSVQFRAMGVKYAQGYFHGRPMPVAELVDFLHSARGATKPSHRAAKA